MNEALLHLVVLRRVVQDVTSRPLLAAPLFTIYSNRGKLLHRPQRFHRQESLDGEPFLPSRINFHRFRCCCLGNGSETVKFQFKIQPLPSNGFLTRRQIIGTPFVLLTWSLSTLPELLFEFCGRLLSRFQRFQNESFCFQIDFRSSASACRCQVDDPQRA